MIATSPATLPPNSLVPDHISVAPLRALSAADESFVERLREEIIPMTPQPACVGLYGSLARREARSDSDIDLLVIRPVGVDEEDEAWRANVETIRVRARRLSGNPVEVMEVGQRDVRKLVSSKKPLWRNIVRDFRAVLGPALADL